MIYGNLAPTVLRDIRPSIHHIPAFPRARPFSRVARLETTNENAKKFNGKPLSADSTSAESTSSKPSAGDQTSSNHGFKELYRSLTPRLRLVFMGLVLIAGTAESLFWFNVIRAKFSGKESNEKNYWLVVLWSKLFGTKPVDEEKSEES
jgi:hypothetical protein